MRRFLGPIAGLGLLAAAGPVQAIPTIDTLTSWNGMSSFGSFGEPIAATIGQTFTVTGPETQLESFTFLVRDVENPDVVDFQAFIYAWDGSKITGSELFGSDNLSTAIGDDSGVFESFTINTGGVLLDAGDQYVAFFSASNLYDGQAGTGFISFHQGSNPYAGGNLVFQNNGTDFGQLSTISWGNIGTRDLAFTATFSAPLQVTEPSILASLGIGLLTIGALSRRRRQS